MSAEIIAAIIAGLVSLCVGCFTFYKTQQLKFFDAYFEKKAQAYADYIQAVIHFVNTKEDFETVYTCFNIAKMYCSSESIKELNSLVSGSIRDEQIKAFTESLDNAVDIFRKDMQACRKYKFE